MSTETIKNNLWIQNPALDSIFYSFGWLIVLFPLLYFKNDILSVIYLGGTIEGMRNYPHLLFPTIVLLGVFVVNYIHRHLTFALVYGEPDEFESRKTQYILTPIILAVVTIGAISMGMFVWLLVASFAWNIFHVVAQKYGITRVYSRKAGYGNAALEKAVIFSWLFYTMLAVPETKIGVIEKFMVGGKLLEFLGGYLHSLTIISYFMLAGAIAVTISYAYNEYLNRDKFSLAKNLFVLSTLAIYSIFFIDLLIGYLVFAFSHALEYVAFVNKFLSSKYKDVSTTSALGLASKKLWLYSSLFSLAIVVFCLIGLNMNRNVFEMYIVGSSFLHFIYDGWIWKMRKPSVGKPFKIKYA